MDFTIGKQERMQALRIAKELFYSKEVIEAIKNAKTTAELDNIMHDARKNDDYGGIYKNR